MNDRVYDALVIGAGFAGLTAARDLAKDGKRVLIVEARDRIGGRTWYGQFADTTHMVEFGGGWVDPVYNEAIMREVERYGIGLAECPDGENQISVLDGATYDSICPLAPADVIGLERALVPILRAGRAIDPEAPLDLQDTAALDVPLDQYLDAFELPAKLRELIGAWNRTSGGCEEADISALHFLSWVPSLDGSAVTIAHFPSHVFADGTVSLAQALLDDSGCEVAYDAPVEGIAETADGVEVVTHGGEIFRGRAAVVAVPLNCWGDIEFRPGLSEAKQAGAEIGQSGTTTKLWALATGLPEKLQGIGERATPLDTFTAQFPVPEGDLVVGFSTRERGLDVGDTAAVQAAFREFIPAVEITKTDTHDWAADPYAKGTWCAAPAGLLSRYASGMAADEGRLIFAGSDIAHAFRGWMTAAVESGAGAASRVSALLSD
jgi:monoamine oxidase